MPLSKKHLYHFIADFVVLSSSYLPGQANRDANYEEKAGAFEHACKLMTDTAEEAATTGGATNRNLRDGIKIKIMEVSFPVHFQYCYSCGQIALIFEVADSCG